MGRQFTFTVTNSLQGDANPAVVGFVSAAPDASDDARFAAHCLAYLDAALRTCAWGGLKITGGKVAPIDGGVIGSGVTIPFPAVEYTAAFSTVPGATAHTVFPCSTGAGGTGLAPRGSSMLVTEATLQGGRHNGRHYLPFICAEAVNPANGIFYDSALASVKAAYDAAFNELAPQVLTKATGALHPVVEARPSSSVARLRSRMK